MRRVLVLLPLLLAGCWSRGGGGGAFGPSDLVVCVRNELSAYGNVIARLAEVRVDVMPGGVSCRRVIGGGPSVTLTATTTGGGAAGPLNFSERLPSAAPGCWVWRLGPGTSGALLPLDCTEVSGTMGSNAPAPARERIASS